eukprot:3740254-Pleurochrysis_carterae.AAC.1
MADARSLQKQGPAGQFALTEARLSFKWPGSYRKKEARSIRPAVSMLNVFCDVQLKNAQRRMRITEGNDVE